MLRISFLAVAILCGCAISLVSTTASATAVTWTIVQSASSIKLAIPDQTVHGTELSLRNQTGGESSWTVGNTAAVAGTLATNYTEGGSLDFIPGSNFVGVNSGNYRPNPAAFNAFVSNSANPDGIYANTSSAPGVFGGKAVAPDALGPNTAAFLAFRSVNYQIDSAPMPIVGPANNGTFNTAGLLFGIANALIDLDGAAFFSVGPPFFAGQLIPDASNAGISNLSAANTSPNGTIIDLGFVRQITIPLNIPIAIDVDGIVLNASLTGQIVAHWMPEPSSIVMGLTGAAALGAVVIRKRRRS